MTVRRERERFPRKQVLIMKAAFKNNAAQQIIRRMRAISALQRKLLICLAGLLLLVFLLGAMWVKDQAQYRLAQERARRERQDDVPFEKTVCHPHGRRGIQFWQNTKSTRAIARFQDSYFAATDGGLVELSPDGNFVRHYTVLDGLTESDLTSLAVFHSKLFIGTQSQGLLTFDGKTFESYRWLDRQAQAITALVAEEGHLLIGTFAGGLIEFDGRRFKELKAGAEYQRLLAINCLTKEGARLYVGTFNDGLWLLEAGRWMHFTSADGLPSDRIVGVAASGERVFIASDLGLVETTSANLSTEVNQSQQKRFRSLAILPSLSSLTKHRDTILFAKDDGEIFALAGDAGRPNSAAIKNLAWPKPPALSNCRLTIINDDVWLLSSKGIWQTREDILTRSPAIPTQLRLSPFGQTDHGPMPASNVISALTVDADGKLWAGNFRNGIDIFSSEGKKLTHLESDMIREINFLFAEKEAKAVLAATSQGVVRLNDKLREISLTKADGLLSNAISHIALAEPSAIATTQPRQNALVMATNKGLSISEHGRMRSLTTVQGLPSDSIYSTLFLGRSLFVGTLGGLAQVESGRVVRVFKDSNSKLTHNWITGLCAADSRLFIGTYGGGIFELAASGELHSFSHETGKLSVNTNAMWSDGERLYVGTLDGVWIFELHSQKWIHLKDELPSKVVLSITGDAKHVYFGTTSGIARIETSYRANG